MKKIILILSILLLTYNIQAENHSLIVLIDTIHQEGIKKQDITVTHQLITALQQHVAPILASVSLWKNIVDRKKEFAKKLDDVSSKESEIYNLFKETNEQLHLQNYNLQLINDMLSQTWFHENYSKLASLQQPEFDQLKFNFLCYIFNLDMQDWSVFDAQTGMLLFVPYGLSLVVDSSYQVAIQDDLLRHYDKKNHIIASMKAYFSNNDTWVIYLSGHGNLKNNKQAALIAGMPVDIFSQFLLYLNLKMKIKLLVYSSCYAGGIHSIEPYKNMCLHFPTIVVALTDAPIYGFGFFEGVKLPPYNNQFNITSSDVQFGIGLIPCASQQFDLFFKRAWSGLYDIQLVQLISQFFLCEKQQCTLQKIENIPLIRCARALHFKLLRHETDQKLIQEVITSQPIVAKMPLLMYVKKIEKIEMMHPVSIISMLPGVQNHQIQEMNAGKISFSDIINRSFLSISDAEKNKNYLINKLFCYNDLVQSDQEQEVTHCMIMQQGLMPKFLTGKVETWISFKSGDGWYLATWKDQKCSKIIKLKPEQIQVIQDVEHFMQQGIDYQSNILSHSLVDFDQYCNNKIYQNDIVTLCLQHKTCKKW